jgi:hypothetical protein
MIARLWFKRFKVATFSEYIRGMPHRDGLLTLGNGAASNKSSRSISAEHLRIKDEVEDNTKFISNLDGKSLLIT